MSDLYLVTISPLLHPEHGTVEAAVARLPFKQRPLAEYRQLVSCHDTDRYTLTRYNCPGDDRHYLLVWHGYTMVPWQAQGLDTVNQIVTQILIDFGLTESKFTLVQNDNGYSGMIYDPSLIIDPLL